jgi:hypothetical protein
MSKLLTIALPLMLLGGCLTGCGSTGRLVAFEAPKPDDQPIFEWTGLGVEFQIRAVGLTFGEATKEPEDEVVP